MTCPNCSRPMDDAHVTCEYCARAKSYQALLAQQKPNARRIEKGEMPVTLTKPAERTQWHIRLSDYPQAWCGQELNTRWRKMRVELPKSHDAICDQCQRVLGETAEAAA